MAIENHIDTPPTAVPVATGGVALSTGIDVDNAMHRGRCAGVVSALCLILFLVFDPVNLLQTHTERLGRARAAWLEAPIATQGLQPPPTTDEAGLIATTEASRPGPATDSPPAPTTGPAPLSSSSSPLRLVPSQFEIGVLQGKITALPKGVTMPRIDPEAPLKPFAPRVTKARVERLWRPTSNGSAATRSNRPRVLQTEMFAQKYGLTNVLMCMAAMMAYGSADDRAVHFPTRSPVKVEDLIDLKATEELLRPTNVVLLSDAEFNAHYANDKQVKARKIGLSFGYRNIVGSKDYDTALSAFAAQRDGMRSSRSILILNHRDFFLSFPFRAISPFDMCFYLRRLVYHQLIRQTASALLKALQAKSKAASFMALHLRLEGDVKMLRKQAASLTPAKLEAFMRQRVVPIIRATKVGAIYVCAGAIAANFVEVLKKSDFGVPIYFKGDFPDLHVPMVGENITVTSHVGASVDALMIKHAAVAVTFKPSTYTTNAVAVRCPSPGRAATTAQAKTALRLLTWDDLGQSSLITPPPGDLDLAAELFPPLGPPPPFEGVLTYDFTEEGDFSEMDYISCEDHFNWCRYQ